jgi:hypothetical protein
MLNMRLHGVGCCIGLLLAVVSCSSPKPTGPPTVRTFQQEGGDVAYAGEKLTDMVTTTNTVVSLDAAQRQIVMRQPDGNIVTYRAGREIANLSDFKVGDPVKATVIEQLGISVVGSGKLPDPGKSPAPAPVMVRARNGAVLTSMPVTVVQFKAVVVQMDSYERQVVVQTPDGQRRAFHIRPEMDLGDLKVGDDVAVQATEAMAIELEKPY